MITDRIAATVAVECDLRLGIDQAETLCEIYEWLMWRGGGGRKGGEGLDRREKDGHGEGRGVSIPRRRRDSMRDSFLVKTVCRLLNVFLFFFSFCSFCFVSFLLGRS